MRIAALMAYGVLTATQAFAQGADGSVPPPDQSIERPTSTAATSSAVSPAALPSAQSGSVPARSTTTQPNPRPAPPAPLTTSPTQTSTPTTSAPLSPQITEANSTSESTPDNPPYILAALGALAILGGAGAAIRNKFKSREEKLDCDKCLNIQKLLEEKFEELTDLKGQLKSKLEEKARDAAREAIAGTAVADLIKSIEILEENYARLKKLFETCLPLFLLKTGDEKTAATAVLMKNGKLLMGKRNYTADKWKDISVWTTPGGRCDKGEKLEETLRREVSEETGIQDLAILDFVGEIPGAKEGDRVQIFFCQTDMEPELREPDKFAEWTWIPVGMYKSDYAFKEMNPAAHAMISKFLERKFGS